MTPPEPSPSPVRGRAAILVYRGIGLAMVGLAALGVALPVLPTVPFLLVALWAFARGSPELHARLLAHPTYGPMLKDWEQRRAIPVRGKVASIGAMSVSLLLLALTTERIWTTVSVGAVMAAVAVYILSRPS
jgi:uncharacterized membrane protein YbaN (DUF454 family)